MENREIIDLDLSELESGSRDLADDFPEPDSIGSWADEVDSDFDANESTEAITFNPKYACQAQKLKDSLPALSSVEQHFERGQHEHSVKYRNHIRRSGNSRGYFSLRPSSSESRYRREVDGESPLRSPLNSRSTSVNHEKDRCYSGKYRNHISRSGNSHGYFSRRPRSSESRYRRELDGESPLRSPLNSRCTSVNHEKDRSYRRQSHGNGYRRTQFRDGIHEPSENTRKRHRTPLHAQTVFSEEDEEGTPILSKWQMKEPKRARSRRRLCLPGDVPDEVNDEVQMEEITEDDDERLARREKDIVYGKSTESYKKYIHLVPIESRHGDCRVHPRTPLKTRKCSRRSWDAQIRIWKLRVHTWAAEAADTANFLKPQESKYPVKSGPRWADVVAGTSTSDGHSCNDVQEKAMENDPNDDDDSFLDSFDFDCQEITDQINDSVKLNNVTVENLPWDEDS